MNQAIIDFSKEHEVTQHALQNILKLSKIDAENIMDELLHDENYTKFFLLLCNKCNSKVKDGLFVKELDGKEFTCPSCKSKTKFKPKDLMITAIYGKLKDMLEKENNE